MVKLKDVVWGEVELVEGSDTNNKGDDVSVMTCCGWPPPINFTCYQPMSSATCCPTIQHECHH